MTNSGARERDDAIRRLIAIYGQLLDSHRLEEWGALFTADASFRVRADAWHGHEAVPEDLAPSPAR